MTTDSEIRQAMIHLPLRVTYRNVIPHRSVGETIRQKAAKLHERCPRLRGIEVSLELPHRHQLSGRHFHVRLLLNVPGDQLVVSRQCGGQLRPDSLDAVLNEAFRAARRALNVYVSTRRPTRREVRISYHATA